jgi:hypothetical protein
MRIEKWIKWLGVKVQACNPSFAGGVDRRIWVTGLLGKKQETFS